ncbi:jerky protein homolog-like [Bactrocera dorsalis]|uniref:Jerky protein homolog-like n=1 Tax=Bactrocera dorsalis TaxID=27457 RepID=A0ABM3IYI7_BACDO|nr:jerky protein homolog-like [Bactrocera dorsalis]
MPTKQRKSLQIRLNLHQKAEILRKLDEGIHGNRLALDYNVSKAAISKIKKKRHEILEAVANTHEVATKKTLHKSEYPVLEARLYKWFLSQRQRNCAMSGPILKARAKLEFAKLHTGKQFHASDGWLANFKKRFGIRHLKICGEILSSDKSGITPLIHNLRAKMDEMEISDMQLYNTDESGLFYRFLPDKTFVAANEKTAPGRKIAKDRITYMLCANADGSHKLKPLIIGKSANPRCFKGFENPLEYDNSQKSWMNSELFFRWFHHSFIKQVNLFFLSFKIFKCAKTFVRFANFLLKIIYHQGHYC